MARPKPTIAQKPSPPPAAGPSPGIPIGFRQGIITAITVLLGFSLAFLQYWGLESPGDWSWHSIAPGCVALASIAAQLVALFRALSLADDDAREYALTVRWFLASTIAMVAWLVMALVEAALG
jgi:hypothetical protein